MSHHWVDWFEILVWKAWSNKVLDWNKTLHPSVRKVCRMKQSFCGKQRRQRGWNDFSTSSLYTTLVPEEPSNSTLRQGRVKWHSFWVLSISISHHQFTYTYIFIACLPDFRHFSVSVVREAQKVQDSRIPNRSSHALTVLLLRKFPWNVNTEF